MPAPEDSTPTAAGPYASAFETYADAGWQGVLVLPPRRKTPAPAIKDAAGRTVLSYTGNEGVWPSYADMAAWAEERPDGNIALRLPRDVVGIDVDAYGDKVGGKTFTDLVVKYGPLPPTWRSTSRDDGISAIRFFRIPQGLAWPGVLGPGIEVIRFAHRYAVVWPSLHDKTGSTYRWINPAGQPVIGVVPRADELPMLPDAWVQGITGGQAETVAARADLTDAATTAWLAQRAEGTPCRAVAALLGRYVESLDHTGGARHEAALTATRALTEYAGEGHTGAAVALEQVRAAFERAIDGDRERVGEWERMVTGAVRLAAANHPDVVTDDPCDNPLAGLVNQATPPRATSQLPQADLAPYVAQVNADAKALAAATAPAEIPDDSLDGLLPAAPVAADDGDPMATLRQQYLTIEVEKERARREARKVLDREETEALAADNPNRFVTGAEFVLNLPEAVPTVWGTGDDILWAEGEALIIAGGSGVGKSTIASQVVAGMLGLGPAQVLGLDVAPARANVLYLAMDRPQQLARALARVFKPEHAAVLDERLKVWQGPPPADVAKAPETLLRLAQAAHASVLVVDSLKDAAIGLSDDAVSAGYNRARQLCLAEGIQVLELHHMVKKGTNGAKPTTLGDVYGGTWLTAGAGSVVLINGDPGDPVVEMRHLKQPMEEVGPYQIVHDHRAGVSSIYQSTDLLTLARVSGSKGTSARAAATALFDTDKPSGAQVEKARRRLQGLVNAGSLVLVPGGGSGGVADLYVAAQPDVDTLGGLIAAPADRSRNGTASTREGVTSTLTLPQSAKHPNVTPRGPEREAVTSANAENVRVREGSRGGGHDCDPPYKGGRVSPPAKDEGRVVLNRGGHLVDATTGEILE